MNTGNSLFFQLEDLLLIARKTLNSIKVCVNLIITSLCKFPVELSLTAGVVGDSNACVFGEDNDEGVSDDDNDEDEDEFEPLSLNPRMSTMKCGVGCFGGFPYTCGCQEPSAALGKE